MPPINEKMPQNRGRPKICDKIGFEIGKRYIPHVIKKHPSIIRECPKTI
jgi:hypothetical protein